MTRTVDTLAQSVAAALRQAIQDGVYLSGDKLIELAISQEMNVSQNTAREAIHILEYEGWAQKRARYGSHVRTFTREEAEEVYALWASVSALALGWALEHIPRTHLTQSLLPVIDNARAQVDTGNTHGVLSTLFNFHEALSSVIEHIGHRPQTGELLMRLRNQARLLELTRERQFPRSRAEWDALVLEYEHLMGMVKFADSNAAREAINERIEADGKALLGAIY
jgi:DNA-binding GntR family transcriptional regulator